MSPDSEALRIVLPGGDTVSALVDRPPQAQAAFVLAHGAGAGMQHVFLRALAHGLASAGIATLRFQFPFAEQGSKRPDAPAVAQAAEPLPGVQGLVFVGFPLHPSGKPGTSRAEHLQQVGRPMLFLQGTRDALADLALMRRATASLGERATLHVVEGADHAFHVLARSGRTDAQVLDELVTVIRGWTTSMSLPT